MEREKTDPWLFVRDGNYQSAIDLYSKYFDEDGRISHIRNRGIIYLFLRNFESSLSDFLFITMNGDTGLVSQDDYIFLGISYWCLHKPIESTAEWEKAKNSPYKDPAGGIKPVYC